MFLLPLWILQWYEDQNIPLINNPIPVSLLLIFFSILLLFRLKGVWAKTNFKSPPSPPRFPIIGHLHYLGSLPHRSLQALSQKYGSLILLQFGFTPTLVVSSAEMGREIMKTHDIIFSDRPNSKSVKEYFYGGKDAVFAPYGEHWRQVRKICVMDLLSLKRVQSFRSIREEEIMVMVHKIKEACLLKKEVNLSDLIIGVTGNIISRTALGKSLEGKKGTELINGMVNLLGGFSFEDLFPSWGWIDVLIGITKRLKKNANALHMLLDEVIEEHLTSPKTDGQADKKDMVHLLLEAENDPSLGIEFTRDNHRVVLLDMFAAGTETSYTVLEWTMTELVTHQDVLTTLQNEVRRVVGTKSKIEEDDIAQMDYLNCVIKESLRLHPPLVLSIPRSTTESVEIQGYHIPAKTKVLVNLWAICRDPMAWDRPNEFIPERFRGNPVDYKGNHFEFLPFGAGRRGCPGIAFSITSIESILANLLHWFDWESVGSVDTTEAFGLSVHLKHPLVLVPKFHFPY